MRNLQRRAEQLARAQQRRRIERIKQAVRDAAPGLSLSDEGSAVVITGRELVKRWLAEPALRWIGMMSR